MDGPSSISVKSMASCALREIDIFYRRDPKFSPRQLLAEQGDRESSSLTRRDQLKIEHFSSSAFPL
jgi:hypothetical protein